MQETRYLLVWNQKIGKIMNTKVQKIKFVSSVGYSYSSCVQDKIINFGT